MDKIALILLLLMIYVLATLILPALRIAYRPEKLHILHPKQLTLGVMLLLY